MWSSPAAASPAVPWPPCSAARASRVTVLEKSPKPEHYKVDVPHFIQAGRDAGAPAARASTRRWSAPARCATAWRSGPPAAAGTSMPDDEHGYNLRREKLDPMLRELAARTPNVEVRQGVTVDAVLRDAAGRPSGLRGRTPGGEEVAIDAKVVVGADGRGSVDRAPGRHPRPRPAPRPLRLHGLLRGPGAAGHARPLADVAHRPRRPLLLPQRRRADDRRRVPAQGPPRRRSRPTRRPRSSQASRGWTARPTFPAPRASRR